MNKRTMARALKRAVQLIGGPVAAAALFDPPIRAQAISQWIVCPVERVLRIAAGCGYAVTPHELRPDVYPHPADGLPARLRERAAA